MEVVGAAGAVVGGWAWVKGVNGDGDGVVWDEGTNGLGSRSMGAGADVV